MVLSTTPSVFTFSSRPLPLLTPFVFPPHPTATDPPKPKPSLLKRHRSLYDTEDNGSRKKRRLRLLLITSRLSRPFSTPASHAVDKGRSKIAVWAKSKQLGSSMLRKAAILNRMRRGAQIPPEILAPIGFGLGLGAAVRTDAVMDNGGDERGEAVIAARHCEAGVTPLPPSPLGLSNYDAFDEEEVWRDDDGAAEEEWAYCPHPDVVAADRDEKGIGDGEEVPRRHMQPKEHKGYSDLNPLDPPASAAPSSSVHTAVETETETRSPNSTWLDEEFRSRLEAVGKVQARRSSFPSRTVDSAGKATALFGNRKDVMADIMQEKGRQRRLLDLRFE